MSNGSVLLLILLVQNINNRFDLRSLLLTVLQEATCVLGLFIKPSDFLFLLLNLFRYLGILLVLLHRQTATGLFGSGDLYAVPCAYLGQHLAFSFTPTADSVLTAAEPISFRACAMPF